MTLAISSPHLVVWGQCVDKIADQKAVWLCCAEDLPVSGKGFKNGPTDKSGVVVPQGPRGCSGQLPARPPLASPNVRERRDRGGGFEESGGENS